MKQLSLFEPRSDAQNVSLQKSRSDAQTLALQRYCDTGKKEPSICVNTYSPGRRKTEYFRVSYENLFGKKKHLHIPGGNTDARLARYRAGKIQAMIDRGAEIGEIIAAVQTYRS